MKKNSLILIICVITIVLFTLAFLMWFMSRPKPLILQGEVVSQSYNVSSKLTGRIDSLSVSVGDMINKGDFVYAVSTPEIDAKLSQAQALLSAADAQDMLVKEGLRPQEIEAAFSMWQKAEAGLRLAQQTYNRVKVLHDEGVVPAQNLDEATANLEAMTNTSLAAKAQYIIAKDGARNPQKKAAAAMVRQAAGGVQEVNSYLDDKHQYSPITGEVTSIIAQKGELVGAGAPVVTIVDTEDVWFSFNVKETLLPKIKKGDKLLLYVPALDDSIHVNVTYIAAKGDYATWSATRTSGDFDIKTFEVRMKPCSNSTILRSGMTALLNWSKIE